MRLRAREGRTLLGVIAAVALLAGCGSSGSGKAPTVNLSRAADVSSSAAGYRTAMTLNETVPGAGAIDMTGTGSFSPAARTGALTMQMKLPPSAGLGNLQLQVVLSKTAIYIKLPSQLAGKIPGGKPWLYVNLAQIGQAAGIPGIGSLLSSGSSLSDPGRYLTFLRATSQGSIKDLGQATVNGIGTTHYQAEIDLSKLAAAVPAADRQAVQHLVAALERKGTVRQFPVQAWIDSSHLIRRIQMAFTEPLSTGQSVAVDLTESFLNYGPQPVAAVPSASQSVNVLSLVHSSNGSSSSGSAG